MPAPNIRSPAGTREIGIAIELVIVDWNRFWTRARQFGSKIIMPIRIFNTEEANRFFSRCQAYTFHVFVLNALALSLQKIRERYQELKQTQSTQQRGVAPPMPAIPQTVTATPTPQPAPQNVVPQNTTSSSSDEDEVEMR